jgi:hypothetical protein
MVSLNLKGTEYSSAFPLVFSEFFFPPATPIRDLMIAVHNLEQRQQWDPLVEHGEILEVVQDSKVLLWNQRVQSNTKHFNTRELLVKKLVFRTRGKTIVYFCSIPD